MHVHGPDPSTWHWWLILCMPAAGNTNLAWKEPVFLALAEKIKERGRGMLLQRNLPGLGVFMFHEIHVSFSLLPNPCLAVIASKNSLHLGLDCKSLVSSCITRTRSVTESTLLCSLSVRFRNGGIHHSSGGSSLQLFCISCDLCVHICRPHWGQHQ